VKGEIIINTMTLIVIFQLPSNFYHEANNLLLKEQWYLFIYLLTTLVTILVFYLFIGQKQWREKKEERE